MEQTKHGPGERRNRTDQRQTGENEKENMRPPAEMETRKRTRRQKREGKRHRRKTKKRDDGEEIERREK